MTETASTTQTRTVKSSELQVGDTVREHGMRVRIDAIKVYEDRGPVYSCAGTVLNLEEVRTARIVPMSFLTTEKWVEDQGWTVDRRDAWTVQGNDLATWQVETA
jgi:hypothetical protein